MTDDSPTNQIFSVTAILIGVLGILVTVIVFAIQFSLPIVTTTPTVMQPTSSPSGSYQPEIIPLATITPGQAQTVLITPLNPSIPTRTPFVLPTIVFTSQLLQLPNLTVTGLSDPKCVPDRIGTIFEFTFYVRNIGRASTRSFGPFDVDVFLILGEVHYGLDEWTAEFNGVIGTSNLKISNLNPGEDIKLKAVLDLKGNRNFGIEVTVNSGANAIREADMTNNSLIKFFSAYCY